MLSNFATRGRSTVLKQRAAAAECVCGGSRGCREAPLVRQDAAVFISEQDANIFQVGARRAPFEFVCGNRAAGAISDPHL